MAPLGSALCPSTSLFFCKTKHQVFKISSQPRKRILEICVNSSFSSKNSKLRAVSEVSAKEATSFGFKNLTETFWVDVQRAEERPLRVKVVNNNDPFSRNVENVAIRVELSNGCVGWGEAAAENLAAALAKAKEACEFLRRSPAMTLNSVFEEIGGILPGQEFASVRAGVEMALIDAVANSIDVPLWRLFGGVSNSLTTAITIPITSPAEASAMASKYCAKGFDTMRFNLRLNLIEELKVIKAVQVAQPHCLFILDANEKYTLEEALIVLEKLDEMGIKPILFEQPVHRDDWNGLANVRGIAREKYGIHVSADESCQTLIDVQKVVQDDIVDFVNVKLARFGVLGSLQVVEIARKSGLSLIIDSMVETRLASGFAGHLACGLGCFKYVNLDAPFMLSDDPVFGGYEVSGPVYKFTNARGQGGFLKQDAVAQ
ncbi:L-Ala-D/L-Glu epimerase [Morus notabilis]|uniref:L-Ala-D/L-Glu epimerase n=2 Tax=Morus notabilis TaxID=981085 RepID=W9S0Y9_9ROSA|nr:L-Ala-D/L-Glu epimerase [Morus notabilis]